MQANEKEDIKWSDVTSANNEKSVEEQSKLQNKDENKAKDRSETEKKNDTSSCKSDSEVSHHECHKKIARDVAKRARERKAYGNLGKAHHRLGDFKTATDYFKRDLVIAKELGDKARKGAAYGNLGNSHHCLGYFERAIDYHERHLKIARISGDKSGEGKAYGNLGKAHQSLGDFEKAIDYHERHLKIARISGDKSGEGKAYGNLGKAHQSLGDFEKAIDYHERHLKIAKSLGDRWEEGSSYGNLGNAYESIGYFEKAVACHKRNLQISQEIENRVGEGMAYRNLGNAYQSRGDFNTAIDYHKRYLDIAEETGNTTGVADSFYCLGRSFESLGCLSEALECYKCSVANYNDVRARLQFKDEWKINLRNMYQSVYAKLWGVLLKQGNVDEALFSAEEGRAQSLKDLMELKYKPPETSHAGSETENRNFRGFPSTTIFMAIYENQEIIFWVLQKGNSVELRRTQICSAERYVSTLMSHALQLNCFGKSDLSSLYDTIIDPIKDLLLGNELVFVPEVPLFMAPFVAFLDSNSKYLCESFKIRQVPSLTSLKLIMDSPADYHSKSGALLVGDPRVPEVTKLRELPLAREEVEMIGRMIGSTPLMGRQATKDEVLRRLGSAALVHIAAHGRDEDGSIFLAPNPTRISRPPEEKDYMLTPQDVLSVQVRARLVVLSTCHSARGRFVKAEGVVGTARAFLGAGARSVVASAWAINDRVSLEYMKSFYKHLLKGNSCASEAMNQTMKYMRESEEFSEVNKWASFTLIGDDVTLEFGGSE